MDDTDGPTTAQLDEMLIIAHELRRLGVAKLIDDRCPTDPRSEVTHGQCVEALIASVLLGTHTLYEIFDTLEPYDLGVAFGWDSAVAQHFHDDRVAAAMDATFEAGIVTLSNAALLRALAVHDLDMSRLQLDTTSVSTYGEYAGSVAPADPDEPQAIPHITRGHSKDYRPDLKQIVYGLAVTADGGVPVFGRATSGNRADVLEMRFMLEQLAKVLPDPTGTTLVGDSKFFSGETLLLARQHGFHVVTMLPRSTGLWGEAFQAFRAALTRDEKLLVLKTVPPEAEKDATAEPEKEWAGLSFDMTYAWEDDAKQTHEVPLRLLVVESSSLRAQRADSARGRRAKERQKLDRAAGRLTAKVFNCEEDATKAAEAFRVRHGPDLHVLTTRVASEQRLVKRGRPGRPRADEPPAYEVVWRITVEIDGDDQILEEAIFRDSCYVIASTLPREGPKAASDREVFDFYREQTSVEAAFRWAKNPLKVAPLFLKTRGRIAALGLVYVLALMTYTLIQRHVRARLQETGESFPGNRGVTQEPTTEVIFRLMRGITTVRLGSGPITISRVTTVQLDMLKLLEHPVLTDPRVRLAPPREASRPRERAYENWRAARDEGLPNNQDGRSEIS